MKKESKDGERGGSEKPSSGDKIRPGQSGVTVPDTVQPAVKFTPTHGSSLHLQATAEFACSNLWM